MDVHLRRGSLQSGSDAESDGAACLTNAANRFTATLRSYIYSQKAHPGRAKAVLKLRKYRWKNFRYAFQQPARATKAVGVRFCPQRKVLVMNAGFDRHFPPEVWEEYAMGVQSAEMEEHVLICPACQELLAEADEYIRVAKAALSRTRRRLSKPVSSAIALAFALLLLRLP
jgi:hypothetical protein